MQVRYAYEPEDFGLDRASWCERAKAWIDRVERQISESPRPFLLADTFQSSLKRPTGEEWKAAKLTAFALQINPSNPYLLCQRVDNIMGKALWPVLSSHPSS